MAGSDYGDTLRIDHPFIPDDDDGLLQGTAYSIMKGANYYWTTVKRVVESSHTILALASSLYMRTTVMIESSSWESWYKPFITALPEKSAYVIAFRSPTWTYPPGQLREARNLQVHKTMCFDFKKKNDKDMDRFLCFIMSNPRVGLKLEFPDQDDTSKLGKRALGQSDTDGERMALKRGKV